MSATTLGKLGVLPEVYQADVVVPVVPDSSSVDAVAMTIDVPNSWYDLVDGQQAGYDEVSDVPDINPTPHTLDCVFYSAGWTPEDILNPMRIFSMPEMEGQEPAFLVREELKKYRCWAEEYQILALSRLAQEIVYYIPELFEQLPETEDLFNTLLGGNEASYGDYYTQLHEIAITIENIRTTANNYISSLDHAKANVGQLLNTMLVSQIQLNSQVTQQILYLAQSQLNASISHNSYEEGIAREAQRCVEEVRRMYRGFCNEFVDEECEEIDLPAGRREEDFIARLGSFRRELKDGSTGEHWEINHKDEFLDECDSALKSNSTLNPNSASKSKAPMSYAYIRKDLCKALYSEYYKPKGNKWFQKNDVRYAFQCLRESDEKNRGQRGDDDEGDDEGGGDNGGGDSGENKWKYCRFQVLDDNDEVEKHVIHNPGSNPSRIIYSVNRNRTNYDNLFEIRCEADHANGYWSQYGFGPEAGIRGGPDWFLLRNKGLNETDLERPDPDRFCRDNQYYITFRHRDVIVDTVRSFCEGREYMACGGIGGCAVDSSGNVACNGSASEEYQEQLDKWTAPDGEFYQRTQSQIDALEKAGLFQSTAYAFEFMNSVISTSSALVSQRAEISNLLRRLAVAIGQLSHLEDRQIAAFNTFVNNRNVSVASSHSSLAEWRERYEFRKNQYFNQLRRARLAAWTARRSIEFRFGIDLSKESEETIYGDIPKQWADSLYDTVTAVCGYPDDGESEGTEISDCLSPEHLIEDYVQKLEDYVASYGNNPNTGWWFHEDDDTGVISLRDHIAVNALGCESKTTNLLYFTEEFAIAEQSPATKYQRLIDVGLDPEWATWAAPWTTTLAAGGSIEPDVVELGTPLAVLNAHYTNEYGLFEDQAEDSSADRIIAAHPSSMEQAVSATQAASEVGAVDGLHNVEFSVYTRTSPIYDNPTEKTCETDREFYPSLGRCGIPCELEADGTNDDCVEGQQCIFAGYQEDGGEEPVEALYTCDWCTANRGCLFQNGKAVWLTIRNELDLGAGAVDQRKIAKNNAQIYPFWYRRSVNTVDDLTEFQEGLAFDDTDPGLPNAQIHAKIETATTRNLVKHSERIDSVHGWYATAGAGEIRSGFADPDGTSYSGLAVDDQPYNGVSLPSGTSVGVAARRNLGDPSVPYLGRFTGSVWLRVPDEIGRLNGVELVLTDRDLAPDPDQDVAVLGKARISVGTTWARYQVIGRELLDAATSLDRVPALSIHYTQNGDGPAIAELGVWGAQIEEGLGTTPYLPTGKNALLSSDDLSSWEVNATTTVVSDGNSTSGPALRGNVYVATGTNANLWREKAEDSTIAIDAGLKHTFSVWARVPSGAVVNALVLELDERQGTTSTAISTSENSNVDDLWRRYSVTHQVSDTASDNFIVTIRGDFSSGLELWGPQLVQQSKSPARI